MKFYKVFFLAVFTTQAMAIEAERIFESGGKERYPQLVASLIKDGMYFSAVPFLKEYLISTSKINDQAVDQVVDDLLTQVGVKQFEALPVNILQKSTAPSMRYILGKKYFRQGKYLEVINLVSKDISDRHPVKPFALLLEASTLDVLKREDQAVEKFKECVSVSDSAIGRTTLPNRIKQLSITRDYCTVGVARALFQSRKFSEANLAYLDLFKKSYVWPEILFEEAWSSFYQKDFNRTLGKLVTYKAPILDFVFNPEIDVLRGLTYLEMCLWEDAKKTVDDFYSKNEKDHTELKNLIAKNGKDYKQYYFLSRDKLEGKFKGGELVQKVMSSIVKDATFIELADAFKDGLDEIESLNKVHDAKFRELLNENIKDSMGFQRNLIGSYVRAQLQTAAAQMDKAFEDMSYIKLEILNRRKTELYQDVSFRTDRGRGNVQYVKRNDKQYFWTFNGEFWADELGDYVFALKSECK